MNLRCLFGSHRYYTVQHFGSSQRRVGCERCGETWGMHDGIHAIVAWDKDIEKLYKMRGYVIIKSWRVLKGIEMRTFILVCTFITLALILLGLTVINRSKEMKRQESMNWQERWEQTSKHDIMREIVED